MSQDRVNLPIDSNLYASLKQRAFAEERKIKTVAERLIREGIAAAEKKEARYKKEAA